jgi:hypothetical protein
MWAHIAQIFDLVAREVSIATDPAQGRPDVQRRRVGG